MLKTRLVFEDGTQISSGVQANPAIRKITLTQKVNAGQELTLGSVCSAMLEAELICTGNGGIPAAGSQVTLYRNDVQMGVFILEKPTRSSVNGVRLTAYDRVSLLDQDLTNWLTDLAGWPYSLYKFAWMVCAQCGLELETESLPNGEYAIEQFSAQGITGRQLLSWVGEIAGRYCIATPEGKIAFCWYTPGTIEGGFVYEHTLHYEDYSVAPIDRVQISLTGQDVGLIYPPVIQGNTYGIQGNFLLTGQTGLETVAQTLLAQLQTLEYTPCRVTVPASTEARPGQILQLSDRHGGTINMLVMSRVQSGDKETLECTGSPNRQSVSAVNQQTYEALSGRVLELQTQVSGLTIENRDAQRNAANMQLTVEGIRTQVQQQEQNIQRLTGLEQTAEQLQLSVQTIQEEGVSRVVTSTGFVFDENGLTVEKDGSDLKNHIDPSGMQVIRGGQQVLLRADIEGVLAADVTVDNYLNMGNYARFENYPGGRTACYYIGG